MQATLDNAAAPGQPDTGSRGRRLKLLVLLPLFTVLSSGVSSGMAPATIASERPKTGAAPAGGMIELRSAAAPGVLARSYGLGVVEVAELPPHVAARHQEAAAAVEPDSCPVQVRGIVQGDSSETTFALIAAGEQTELLGAGQGARMSSGWVAVSAIARDHVVIRYGSKAFHCPLRGSAQRDPER